MANTAPPPPSYNQATSYTAQPQYPPPNPDSQTATHGGLQYIGVPQRDYGTDNSTGHAPPQSGSQSGGYPPSQPSGYPPAQPAGYPLSQSAGYPPSQPAGFPPSQPVGYQPTPAAPAGYNSTSDVTIKPDDQNYNNWQDETFIGNSFNDKAIRRAFIKKVYLILLAQLCVTVAFIAFFMFHEPTKRWVQSNSWFYYTSYGLFVVLYITLVCCPNVRRKFPVNFICLALFTLVFSYMTGTITSYYDTKIVLIAAGITAAVCLSISLFAIQTRFDFTMCSGLLFALSMVLFFFGISCIVVYSVWGVSYIMQCVYGAIAALLFSLFLAYDTQMVMGGHKYELSPEEYIFGALQLYLDIVYIFLIILSCFSSSSN